MVAAAEQRLPQHVVQERAAFREVKSEAVDSQVRIVVVSAVAGSLIVGGLLLFAGWRLLLLDAQRRQRQDELEEENLRVAESARVKTQFVAHMSHEFRTPLTAILGLGEMLYDEKVGPLSAAQKACIDDIVISGRHLLGLINQVLDLAKVEAGKIALDQTSCDPRRVAEETIDTLRPLAQEKQIALEAHFERAPKRVVTDAVRFKQMLYNYLSNALEFTPAGGSVTVRIVALPNGRFRTEVCDSGAGIAPADIPKLFAEFSQVGSARHRDGAGLGLALTKHMVEAQGGSVGVHSRVGSGSVFYAELPCDARAVSGAAA